MLSTNKVLIYTPYAEPERGACTLRVNFFRETLEQEGFDCLIVAPKRGLGNANGVKRVNSILELVKVIKSFKPDLAIGVSPPLMPNLYLLVLSKILGFKFLLDAKDDGKFYEDNPKEILPKVKRFIYLASRHFVYSNSDKLIFLTMSDLEEAKRNYALKDEKLSIVMNGTDASLVYRDKKARDDYRNSLGLTKDHTLVCYLGGLGDEEVLAFLDTIKRDFTLKKLFLVIIVSFEKNTAGIKEITTLKNKIRELGLEKFVRIHENIAYSQVKYILSGCDFGVIPWPNRLITSLPVKVFDYMACGLVVGAKASKNSELYNFIESNKIGFCCENWHDFSSNFLSFIQNKKAVKFLSKKNQALAKEKFDRSIFKKDFLSAVENVLRK